VRSDGQTLRINSGTTDTWYAKAVAFITGYLPNRYRFALAVATHCEAKMAVAMRLELSSTLTNLLDAGRPANIHWQALDPASRNRAAS